MSKENPLDGWLVLVVDDEFDSRQVAALMLETAGATVITAQNGKEALEMIIQQRPNFVLSDLSMPVLDGWQLMYALNQNRATHDIPVIALTAHAMRGDRERAMAAGFRNFINKPLDSAKFMNQLLVILLEQPEFAGKFD
ncbi:MAG: response regulator [bacterium]|nr:response regulator [bacterium]